VIEAMEQGKTCTKCGEWKIFERFSKNKGNKDGFLYQCKECEKRYLQKNKERIKERDKQYRQKNKEQIIERRKKHYQKNAEQIKEQTKQYREDNKERIKEYKKQYWQDNNERFKKYRQNNIKRIKEYHKKYYKNNYDIFYQGVVKRRSYKHKVNFKPFERQQILERDKWACQSCGIKVHDRRKGDWNTPDKAHIDHIIPISKGGNSEPNNLQILCRTCNLSKYDKVEKQLSLL
jgi:5-methylcytosine-specific restriction endonuclease McrA